MIFENIILVFFVLIAIGAIVIGILYLNIVKKAGRDSGIGDNQKYVKDHLDTLGAHNWGTSMDERDIYVVSSSKLGF